MQTQPAPGTVGSAARWGPLWGARAADWALSEDQQTPTYEAALARVDLRPGSRVLDIGCGVGSFLELVVARGAEGSGIDASEALIDVARRRLPGVDLRVGEMQALPYDDDTFDLVAGFNCFFFADDIVAAFREARRVAKPGAPVVIQVWGRHDRCDLEAVKQEVVRPLLPPRPPDAPPDPDLSEPGVLEALAAAAGLTPETALDVSWAYRFPDPETLGRAMLAPAGLALLAGPEREPEVRARMAQVLAPCRQADGSYRVENEFRIVIARA
jgi:SAM-dependent methyltransferase